MNPALLRLGLGQHEMHILIILNMLYGNSLCQAPHNRGILTQKSVYIFPVFFFQLIEQHGEAYQHKNDVFS